MKLIYLALLIFMNFYSAANASTETASALKGEFVDEAKITSADMAIEELKKGNERFLNKTPLKQDFHSQILATKDGQHPYAVIVSCLDSRIPPEILFDNGFGDIFMARVAGNIENNDILGSLEFATAAKGSKLVVVLGHSGCGAVEGACNDVKLGHLTKLLHEIKPAEKAVKKANPKLDTKSKEYYDLVAEENVKMTVADIQKKSSIIKDLVKSGKVKVVGAMYDISTGKVRFL